MPRPSRPRQGYDGVFVDLVRPLSPADGEDAELQTLRAMCDAFLPQDSRTWLQAVTFLRALDDLDRQGAAGGLESATYTRLVDALHRETGIEVWLCAGQVTRLCARIIAARHTRQTPPGGADHG